MEFTVTPSRATSRESCLNAAVSPPRCAVESIRPGIGSTTLLDAIPRMRPKPRSRIPAITAVISASGARISSR